MSPAQRFAAIGDDGCRPVVWGVGGSERDALRDGARNLDENLSESDSRPELRITAITEERYRAITAGDVDAAGL